MRTATTARTMARIQKPASGSESTTSLSAITMISAERMKSVRMAPATVCFSCSGVNSPVGAALLLGLVCVAADPLPAPCARPRRRGSAPPKIRMTGSSHGRNWPSSSAAGRMKSSLLRSEPIAIFLMIGSSRSAAEPWRYCGVTAVSSTTTPAALALARPAAAPMSSTLRGRQPGQRGDVVEQGEESAGHGDPSGRGSSTRAQPIDGWWPQAPSTSRRMTQRHLAICRSRTKPSSS